MQNTYQRSTSPTKKQRLREPPSFGARAPPPPPPMRTPILTLELRKSSSKNRLGVRFLADSTGGGAVVESIEPYGLAWRSKLRPGDVLVSVSNASVDYDTPCGYRAAEVLRPLSGIITAKVMRKRVGKAEAAALRIQAAAVGHAVRLGYGDARCAALCIQTHFRRWSACFRVCEAMLAIRHIQEQARVLIARQRSARRSRKPSDGSIRAPACLE